ncbi:hypothetical protein ACBR40_21770 [Nonomuraea sp. AD125B]|uniref:hypothetical protein n=1 Tax=Nonomuraea sp. AD125B TaxID=3242897 RepID=UPI0035298728
MSVEMQAFTVSGHEPGAAGRVWSAISDVGEEFEDGTLSMSTYLQAEDRLLRALDILLASVEARHIDIRHPSAWAPLPRWLGGIYHGKRLAVQEVESLARTMLREYRIYVQLEFQGKLKIAFNQDMCMHVALENPSEDILSEIEGLGLKVSWSDYESAFGTDIDDVPGATARPVGPGFWSEVREMGAREGVPDVIIQEKWAFGTYGTTWYRVPADSPEAVARYLSPCSMVSAFADVSMFEVAPGPDALVAICNAMAVPLDERALICVSNPGAAGVRLEARPFTGFASLQAMLAAQSETITCFFDPEDGPAVPRISAVQPDRDGVLQNIWGDVSV